MSKTVVIFNSPANTGKDVSAKMMQEYFNSGEVLAFKDALYNDTAKYFNIHVDDLINYHNNRDLKNIPDLMFPKFQQEPVKQYVYSILYALGAVFLNPYLMSLGYYSSREALIHVSENVIKPKYGKEYYGNVLLDKVLNSEHNYFFISDGGHKEEIAPLVENNCNVIIVQLERDGCTFDGDSRYSITKEMFENVKGSKSIKFVKMLNNGTLDDLYNNIVALSFDLVLDSIQELYGGKEDEYEIVYE